MGLIKLPAALFNKQSTFLNFENESLITLETISGSLTSHATGKTLPPNSFIISSATFLSKSSLLLVITMLAPKVNRYSDIDFPNPEPPPVTIIVLPFKLFSFNIPLLFIV